MCVKKQKILELISKNEQYRDEALRVDDYSSALYYQGVIDGLKEVIKNEK